MRRDQGSTESERHLGPPTWEMRRMAEFSCWRLSLSWLRRTTTDDVRLTTTTATRTWLSPTSNQSTTPTANFCIAVQSRAVPDESRTSVRSTSDLQVHTAPTQYVIQTTMTFAQGKDSSACRWRHLHRVLKNKQNYFCYSYVKLPPNLTIFGINMANCLKLCEVHSFSPHLIRVNVLLC